MPRFLIKLRKRLLLPRKWRREECKVARKIKFPPKIEFVERRKLLMQDIYTAERGRDSLKAAELKGQIKTIDWIIEYGNAENK